MLSYGPTGALNEYQYKGGSFHGVHYGDFHSDSEGLFALITKEEEFLLKSNNRRRILFDLYHTDLTDEVIIYILKHIEHIAPVICKIAFAAEPSELRKLRRAIRKRELIPEGCCLFEPDQETGKTWLVSDH